MSKVKLTNADVLVLLESMYLKIYDNLTGPRGGWPQKKLKLYGVPRGGVSIAYWLLNKWTNAFTLVDDPKEADIIVDDLIDSGETKLKMTRINPHAYFYPLIDKRADPNFKDTWVIFPWEESEKGSIEDAFVRLLQYIGEDPSREGLRETPKRMAAAWGEWTSGMDQDPKEVFKVFADGGEEYNEMILLDPIPFFSHCEHHMAAIFGDAYIAYIPDGKIAGLSKFARLVDIFARRLQVQERLTTQIASTINEVLKPKGVAVFIKARHFCIESRGVQKPGVATKTSALKGLFLKEPSVRAEFFSLIGK